MSNPASRPHFVLLNGPNLRALGTREPHLYGTQTLAEIEAMVERRAARLGATLACHQSNHEGALIDWMHDAKAVGAAGLIVNLAGFTHTSVALRDAIVAVELPTIEVHLSNVYAREPFRHSSLTGGVCVGVITGLGARGYELALDALFDIVSRK